jgi:hypothetical protein
LKSNKSNKSNKSESEPMETTARQRWRWTLSIALIASIASAGSIGCSNDDGGGDAGPRDGGAADLASFEAGGDASIDANVDAPPAGSWHEVKTANAPMDRSVHRLVYDRARKQLLSIGGQPAEQAKPDGEIWRFDGADWLQLTPATTALAPRKNHGVAYDAKRQRVVVFGGIVGGLAATPVFLDDTWEWDGSDWIERATAGKKPRKRAGHALAYDAARGEVVLFGGLDGAVELNDTWVYADGVWTKKVPKRSPPLRFNTQMVYDEERQQIVLFGGSSLVGSLDDTWTWDGETWVEQTVSVRPPARGFHALAYDPRRRRVVLGGGTTSWPPNIAADNMFADHWEWDGQRWRELPAPAFGLRAAFSWTFDRDRQHLVLFGGFRAVGASKGVDDDTWEYRD